MASPPAPLTEAEKAFFLKHGYIKLTNCFTREQAAEVTRDVWTRLGMSPTDKSTWTAGRTNMPGHRVFDCAALAPKAWSAICELCGGEERLAPDSRDWKDSLIVSLGTEGMAAPAHAELGGWHVDGDFFVHYLDSPEQALLVIPLWSDVVPGGGGTVVCPPAVGRLASWLYWHPEGVAPTMIPRAHPDFEVERNLDLYSELARSFDDDDGGAFVEATGQVGDVYLMHPLMMHSATTNPLRRPRIITNPPVSLKEPHCFDREDGNYSLVEQKTRREVGEDRLKGWKITGPREARVPVRLREQEEMRQAEVKRLEEMRTLDETRKTSLVV